MKVLIFGDGKMGKILDTYLREETRHCQTYLINIDKQADQLAQLSDIDGIIDFSHPSWLPSILSFALANKKPLVIATTGYSKEDEMIIEKAAQIIPILKSANFCLGINQLATILPALERKLPGKISIVETHHSHKIDQPSGTAILLASKFNQKIETVSLRGGDVVGDHKIIFYLPEEVIEITHRAINRRIFARGAYIALLYLLNQKPGLYSFAECLEVGYG